jgi:RNA polymerase sigma-70 factor (sigma-E family)
MRLRDVTTTLEERVGSPDDARGLPQLFNAHYRRLLALATLVSDDRATAEDMVQEAFARLHGRTLDDPERALAYLRSTILNLSRSRLRRLRTARKHERSDDAVLPSAEEDVVLRDEQRGVLAALRTLSPRQREALVLRYWGDLSEADIATAMGLSTGAVKSHTARGMAALRRILEPTR